MTLAEFFARAPAYLFQEGEPGALERALGPSPSGSVNLAFYPVLVRRNVGKILLEVYPGLRALIEREHDGLWRALVEDFWRERPPRGWDPNLHFAAGFPAFVGRRREHDPRVTELHEELADFHWAEFLVWAAPDELPQGGGVDGVDHRLFVRQYSRRVPELARALVEDPGAPIPAQQPTPTLIYRDPASLRVRVLYPTVTALVVLSGRRKGARAEQLVSAIPGLSVALLEQVERELLEHGVALDGPRLSR